MRGGWSAAAGFAIRLGARLLFLLVAGRLFGATLFGAFSLAVAVVELAVTVGAIGTKRTLFQFLDQHDPHAGRPLPHIAIDAAVLVAVTSAALALVVMAAATVTPASVLPPSTARALWILAPMIGGQALLDLFSAATRWRHLIRYEVIGRSIIEPYVGIAATLLAVRVGLTSDGLLIGYVAGTVGALAYVATGARRSFGGFSLGSYRLRAGALMAMLRGTVSNTTTDFLNALYARLDLYLVGALLGEAAAGIYGVARQVRTPIRQVRQSFDGLLTPIVARTLAATGPVKTGEALASAARLILTIQLPVLIVLAALGVPILNAIGPGFAAGYWALVLLAAAESIQGAYGVGDLIFVYRKPELGLWITAVSIVTGLVAGFALIPWWGVTGAGVSVLVSYGLRALHRRSVLARHFSVKAPLTYSAGPLLAAALGTAAALLAARLVTSPSAQYVAVTLTGLAVFGGAVMMWLRATGSTLQMQGFVASARTDQSAGTRSALRHDQRC